jgi:hypothetical protein
MALPGYTADASVYKTMQSYRGHTSKSEFSSTLRITAQDSYACSGICAFGNASTCVFPCLAASSVLGPLGAALCVAACAGAFAACVNACENPPVYPDPSPNPTIPPTPAQCGCPSGQKCCECDDNICRLCVGGNQVCP